MTFQELDKILLDHGFSKIEGVDGSYLKTIDSETHLSIAYTNDEEDCAYAYIDEHSSNNHVYLIQFCAKVAELVYENEELKVGNTSLPL